MRRAMILLAAGFAALVAGAHVPAHAQSDGKPLAFEVVSIKPAPPIARGATPCCYTRFEPGGRFVSRNMPLISLLMNAYGGDVPMLRREQVIGAPSWINSTQFDIEASVSGTPSAAPISMDPTGAALLRSLLEDRFTLRAHIEQRELPFYALILAKSDGTLGPNLRHSSFEGCDAVISALDAARRGDSSALATLPAPSNRPLCAIRSSGVALSGGSVTISQIAGMIGVVSRGATVLDRTGLTGTFDVDLHWAGDLLSPATAIDSPADGPSLFTAVQEQLGLKLESRREPRDVLVIDHVELPTPN